MTDRVDWNAYLSTRKAGSYTDRNLIAPYLASPLLDVGCSYGVFAEYCVRELGLDVKGVDPSSTAIGEAARLLPEGDFRTGVAESLPYPDGTFQTVVSIEVVKHLLRPELFFSEAFRVLRPGGRLIVQTPNYPIKRVYDFFFWAFGKKDALQDDPTHVFPFSFGKMRSFSRKAGFRVTKLAGRNVAFEMKFPLLSKLKKGPFASVFSQKMILIAEKT